MSQYIYSSKDHRHRFRTWTQYDHVLFSHSSSPFLSSGFFFCKWQSRSVQFQPTRRVQHDSWRTLRLSGQTAWHYIPLPPAHNIWSTMPVWRTWRNIRTVLCWPIAHAHINTQFLQRRLC